MTQPPDDAYSRVTRPEQYASVVAAADALVDALVTTYDVEVTSEVPDRAYRGRRLTPRSGGSLVVGATDFPGVVVQLGFWTAARYPACGCDACDERPADLIKAMYEHVSILLDGQLVENWDGRWLTMSAPHRSSRSSTPEEHAYRLRAAAPPGTFAHPAWPRRDPPW